MLTRLAGGRIVDPANRRDAPGDLFLRDGVIVEAPPPGVMADRTFDVSGRIVMAGGIDVHSHIAGGNVALARMLLPEPGGIARLTARETGRLYAAMGYTLVVEPAVPPSLALRTHLELDDIPIIDRAGLAVLGNDEFLLDLVRSGERSAIRDHVAHVVSSTRCLGVKTINAGGAAAFKENVRSFGLDDTIPSSGVSSRAILTALHEAVESLGLPHPLHVHCSDLGMLGAPDTVAATADAAGGRAMHFAHLQFYAYDPAGSGMESGAARLVEAMERHPNATVDVGQVMFGQTITISLDVIRQFAARNTARPRKWIVGDGEEGAGIVPFAYRASNIANAIQWAAGLEIFLLTTDPWRVLLTTDHPNGAPFTTYPEILHLLMDRDERARAMQSLPAEAMARTTLPSITREYTLSDVATITRAAPARLLGLPDRGHLGPGAIADVAVYHDDPDRTAMFSAAHLVFKDGELVVRDGEVVRWTRGRTETARPGFDRQILKRHASFADRRGSRPPPAFPVADAAFGPDVFRERPCRN